MIQNHSDSARAAHDSRRRSSRKFNKALWPIYSSLVEQVSTSLNADDASIAIGCAGVAKGAGATTVGVNLAIAYSMIFDHPVLFINGTESDQRLSSLLGSSSKDGVESLVANHCEISDAISPTSFAGLDYLNNGLRSKSAGFSPQLMSRFPDVLDVLKVKYRTIIVDLPDFQQPSSSSSLAHCLDGVLLVLQAGKVKTPVATKVTQRLERNGVKLLGAVLNRCD